MPRFTSVRSIAAAMLCIGIALSIETPVWSQDYPTRPIRIDTSGIGGGADLFTRIIAQAITGALGQPVIVENLSGGILVAETAAKARPDGYTLLYAGSSFMFGPFFQKTPYDPIKDFAPISIIAKSPAILVVNSSVPVTSVREFIDLAKVRPGELNYGSATIGSGSDLSMELLMASAGIKLVRVPYKGGGPAITALLAGEVQAMIADPGLVAPLLQSGSLRALGVTSLEVSPLFPGLPTIAATVPGYVWETVDGMWAPAGTPAAIIDRLNREIVRAVNTPEVKERFFSAGAEVVGSSPEALAARMKSDMARVGKLVSDAGIRAQ